MFQNNHFQPAGLSQVDLYVHETASKIERANATPRFEGVACVLPQPANSSHVSAGLFIAVIHTLHAITAQLTHRTLTQQH
jgi:hypothetical protein